MFVATALVYPGVLALLCLGAGLAVDRAAGSFLPGVLLPAVGLAALIALAELATYVSGVAPATPISRSPSAAIGFALGWSRVLTIARRWREHRWQLAVPVAAYVVAAAPVLFAGRPTFSAYMVLDGLRAAHAGSGFPDPSRPALRAPRPASTPTGSTSTATTTRTTRRAPTRCSAPPPFFFTSPSSGPFSRSTPSCWRRPAVQRGCSRAAWDWTVCGPPQPP